MIGVKVLGYRKVSTFGGLGFRVEVLNYFRARNMPLHPFSLHIYKT